MKESILQNNVAWQYYQALLQRYARRLIHNDTAAAAIASQALQDLAHTEGPVICKQLRQFIKMDVQHRCYYWKQAQVFNRPPVAIPVSSPGYSPKPPVLGS